jgi:hypothetical protein
VADPTTGDQIVKWALRQLGFGIVKIELTEEHAVDAFDSACRWYIAHKGIKRLIGRNLTPGVSEYALPSDVDQVIEAWFPGDYLDTAMVSAAHGFVDLWGYSTFQNVLGAPSGVRDGIKYGTFSLMQSHNKMAKQTLSAEPAWDYDKPENMLRVSPSLTGSMVIRYASNTLTTDQTGDIATRMSVRDRDLIMRYTVAALKNILGRVRGKYTDWPSAGGSKSMDGDTLLGEAQGEFESLTQTLIGLSDPVPFIIG